jgi:hypothetical protein
MHGTFPFPIIDRGGVISSVLTIKIEAQRIEKEKNKITTRKKIVTFFLILFNNKSKKGLHREKKERDRGEREKSRCR